MDDLGVDNWLYTGKTVRGVSHVKSAMPCQDALGFCRVGAAVILAVADGHGSDSSPRSDIGAQIAVQTALEFLSDFYSHSYNEPSSLGNIISYVEDQLPRALAYNWAERVREHARQFPDLIATLEARPEDVLIRYGSTLLAVLAAPEFLLFLQLGDGDILIVEEQGETVWPIEADVRLIGNATTSLCSPNAWREMRLSLRPVVGELPALILLSTDGYKNAFINKEHFLAIGPNYLNLIREHGIDFVTGELEQWLMQASEFTGDDVTLGLICRGDLSAPIEVPISNNKDKKSDFPSPTSERLSRLPEISESERPASGNEPGMT